MLPLENSVWLLVIIAVLMVLAVIMAFGFYHYTRPVSEDMDAHLYGQYEFFGEPHRGEFRIIGSHTQATKLYDQDAVDA